MMISLNQKKKECIAATTVEAVDGPVAAAVDVLTAASSSRALVARPSRERTPPPRASSPAAASSFPAPAATTEAFGESSVVYINGWRETHNGQLLPGTDMPGVQGVVTAVLPVRHYTVKVGFNLHCVPGDKLQASFVQRPCIFR